VRTREEWKPVKDQPQQQTIERSKKLKVPKINRKFILCAVLAVAIIGMFLVPAASVTAATQDWPLQLVGATAINVTQPQFEAMAASNPAIYTDPATSDNWTGVALWRLIALVDDGDSATFNDALASVYSVAMTAADNYIKTIAPPYAGVFEFARNENILVANKLNGAALPMLSSGGKMYYPLRVTGSGCTLNNQRVGGLVKIELVNLPVTAVSLSPASQAVANGASFTINLAIDTDTASRGWQANVDFDATRMSCSGVVEGSFLSAYAIANGGGTVSGGAATIDNTGGHVTIPGYAITGAGAGGPTGTGTLCTLAFTAKASIDNFASITPSGVVVSGVTGVTIPGVVVTGGMVAIGNVPMPDLVVSALSTTKIDDTTYTITYTVTNQGNAAAGACSTSITIDGTPITIACPALVAGASDTKTTAAQTYSIPNDVIVATADSASVVAESNEGNNTKQLVYAKAGDHGDTPITSGIDAKLVLTVPAPITWQLQQGQNTKTAWANLKCNTPWQLQVSDQDPTTGGRMAPWDGSNYVAGIKLVNAMQVGCQTGLLGLPDGGTIVTGDLPGQNGDSGRDLEVNFSQQVLYSDQANGVTYHIVVTFTASSTF
jgi:CheY-specific phosphatase CheX